MNQSVNTQYISSPSSFEFDVCNKLLKLCSLNNQPMLDDGLPYTDKNRLFIGKISLPEGCKQLGIDGETNVLFWYYYVDENIRILESLSKIDFQTKYLIFTYSDIKHQLENLKLDTNKIKIISYAKLLETYKTTIDALNKKDDVAKNSERKKKIKESMEGISSDISPEITELNRRNEYIIKEAKSDFKNGNVTLFLGAGVSISMGVPSWNNLIEGMLNDSIQKPFSDKDYPAISESYFNSPLISARQVLYPYLVQITHHPDKTVNIWEKIKDLMKSVLYSKLKPTSDLILTLSELCNPTKCPKPVQSIITFNYDDLLETQLKHDKVTYNSIYREGRFIEGSIPIIHVHGIIYQNQPSPSDSIPVLSEAEYHTLYEKTHYWANVEILHALYRNTCIFIGLSMTDPNLRRLMEFVKLNSKVTNIQHYVILENKKLKSLNNNSATPTKHYRQVENKQIEFLQRQEFMFSQLGANVIWYDEGKHEQVPEILKEIAGLKP
ncbi:MAG: SIR2 family protein [Muribaculaceae bacterium]|nr:SIR2 family protein [Muribaculaceae bacterium]